MAGSGTLVCGPGYEYFLLAERLRRWLPEAEDLSRRLAGAAMAQWQSPAGAAFGACLTENAVRLEELRDDIAAAAWLAERYAEDSAHQQLAQNGLP